MLVHRHGQKKKKKKIKYWQEIRTKDLRCKIQNIWFDEVKCCQLQVSSANNFSCVLLLKHCLPDLRDFFIISPRPPPPPPLLLAARIHTSYCSLRSPCSLCLCSSAALVQNTVTSGKRGGLSSLLGESTTSRDALSVSLWRSLSVFVSLVSNRLFVISEIEHFKNSTWSQPPP